MKIEQGILNTGKGARPFRACIHGRERMSAFSSIESARAAQAQGRREAFIEQREIQEWSHSNAESKCRR